MNRAVFVDRDGVLNRAYVEGGVTRPPLHLAEVEILPGVPEACAAIRTAGWLLIGVTNQPDIARGTQDPSVVHAINESIGGALGLTDMAVCPHDDADGCTCRKPKPGMLHDQAAKWEISLGRSVMVGDRWSDVEAGRSAGCATVQISPVVPDDTGRTGADLTVVDLASAVPWILSRP